MTNQDRLSTLIAAERKSKQSDLAALLAEQQRTNQLLTLLIHRQK